MPGPEARTDDYQRFIVEPKSLGTDLLRYGSAMVVVAVIGVGAAIGLGRASAIDEASEVDDAVMIDLPPADASSAPASDATEGPEQHAVAAVAAQQTPEQIEPPQETPHPPDVTHQAAETDAVEQPPIVPDAAAVLARKREDAPPTPVAAPATPAQDERAPQGAAEPTKTTANNGDEGRPHASKHAITAWQRSLVQRLQVAKRSADNQPHPSGTVSIAFTIDATGAMASERVAKGSGSAALDRAAMRLVGQAAPFPAPPAGIRQARRLVRPADPLPLAVGQNASCSDQSTGTRSDCHEEGCLAGRTARP